MSESLPSLQWPWGLRDGTVKTGISPTQVGPLDLRYDVLKIEQSM